MAEDIKDTEFRQGPVTVKTKIPQKYQSRVRLEIARRHYAEAQRKNVRFGVDHLKGEIRRSNKVASGRLLNSVSSRYVEGRSASSVNLESSIIFTEPGGSYAHFANEGRGPDRIRPNYGGRRNSAATALRGMSPMVFAIREWMAHKGIDPKYLFYIVRKIKLFGTNKRGTRFIERAQVAIERKSRENFAEARRKIEEELKR